MKAAPAPSPPQVIYVVSLSLEIICLECPIQLFVMLVSDNGYYNAMYIDNING